MALMNITTTWFQCIHVYVLNENLCKEVIGGLFLFVLYTYYLYDCINLFSSEVGAKVYKSS